MGTALMKRWRMRKPKLEIFFAARESVGSAYPKPIRRGGDSTSV